MGWYEVIDYDVTDRTIKIPDDCDGVLVTKPCKLTNVTLENGMTQLVIRAPCEINGIANNGFGADGIIIASSYVKICKATGHLPRNLVPYPIRHPDYIQLVCLDENVKPVSQGILEDITLEDIYLYAPDDATKNLRGVSGVVAFDCEVRGLTLTNFKFYTDISEHGISLIKPVDCLVQEGLIKSVSGNLKPGIVFKDRKQLGAGSGNIIKNVTCELLDLENTETINVSLLNGVSIMPTTKTNVFNIEDYSPKLKALPKGIPRGYRNNNPGNIKDFGINWFGLLKESDALSIHKDEFSLPDGSRMCVFDTPMSGIRAIVMDLLAKQRKYKECYCIRGIMQRYAPAGKENPHQEQYIWFIANRIGVSDKEVISVKDYKTVRRFVEAIMLFENGTNIDIPYSDQMIDDGIAQAGIAMQGEEKLGDVKDLRKSNGIQKGAIVAAGSTTIAAGKVVVDMTSPATNPTPADTANILNILKDLATANDTTDIKNILVNNQGVILDLIKSQQGLSLFDYVEIGLLLLIAFAALDWMLDRRLTNMMRIK